MTVWEEDLDPNLVEITVEKHMEEIAKFLVTNGQKHSEITANLGYPLAHSKSDELLVDDYFYLEGHKKWYPKSSSMYTILEQKIANFLRDNRDDY